MIQAPAEIFDPATSAQLTGTLGTEFHATLLTIFRRELTSRPGEIAALVVAGESVGARAAAHHLKGAALIVGAGAVASAANAVEHAPDERIALLARALSDQARGLVRRWPESV